MNEEINCITNKGKMANNEWENDNSDFLWALCSVYKELWQFFCFSYLLTCVKKDAWVLLKVIYISTSQYITIKTVS